MMDVSGEKSEEGGHGVGLGAAEIADPGPGGRAQAERARVEGHRAAGLSLLDAGDYGRAGCSRASRTLKSLLTSTSSSLPALVVMCAS